TKIAKDLLFCMLWCGRQCGRERRLQMVESLSVDWAVQNYRVEPRLSLRRTSIGNESHRRVLVRRILRHHPMQRGHLALIPVIVDRGALLLQELHSPVPGRCGGDLAV